MLLAQIARGCCEPRERGQKIEIVGAEALLAVAIVDEHVAEQSPTDLERCAHRRADARAERIADQDRFAALDRGEARGGNHHFVDRGRVARDAEPAPGRTRVVLAQADDAAVAREDLERHLEHPGQRDVEIAERADEAGRLEQDAQPALVLVMRALGWIGDLGDRADDRIRRRLIRDAIDQRHAAELDHVAVGELRLARGRAVDPNAVARCEIERAPRVASRLEAQVAARDLAIDEDERALRIAPRFDRVAELDHVRRLARLADDQRRHVPSLPNRNGEAVATVVQSLSVVEREDDVVATDPRTVDTVDVPAALRGTAPLSGVVGHYAIDALIGAGGMGEVYRATDEQLHRTVAIKVMRDASRGLLEEAQAMAKLSHPNIVVVYEARLVDGRVFIAMEYVAGTTLRAWVKDRSWREIVRMYVAAGRGLAALHAAKLVHRDFKPDNVLVGDDGRPRVADFGLAAREAEAPAVQGGTLRYMAPEQQGSAVVDARSDQFAFCVALLEALGTRAVPARIRATLERGRAMQPDDRWPSLDALLAELERDPAQRRRRIAAVVGVVALAGTAGFALYTRGHDPAAACDAVAGRIAAAWTPFDAGLVRARFAASKRPYAAATTELVRADLDRYADSWSAMRRDVCLATAVRHEQTPHSSELQVQCLDRLAANLSALVVVFERFADGPLVDQAIAAVNQLRAPAECADAQALDAIPAPSPAQRARVKELQAEHAAIDAAYIANRYKPTLARAKANVADADALGYAPSQAEAVMSLAVIEAALRADDDAERDLQRAVALAATAHDDHVLNVVTRSLVQSAITHAHYDEAAERLTYAQAVLARSGNSPLFASRLEDTHSNLLLAKADYAGALAASDHAIQIAQTANLKPLERASLLNQHGRILYQMHRPTDAITAFREAQAIWMTELGAESPSIAGVLLNIAGAEMDLQQFDAAERDLDHSALLTEAAFGPDALNLGRVLNNRCEVHFDRHDIAAATKDCERALAIKTKATKPNSPELVSTLMTLARLADQRDDPKAADAIHARILEIHLAALGEHHPKVAQDLYDLAQRALREHRLDEARQEVSRGLKIVEAAHEPTLTANGQSFLADVDLARGDLAAARAEIRDALAGHEALVKTTTTPDVPQYLADDHDLTGRIDQAAGDLVGAERELRRSVELAEPVAGVGQALLAPHLEHLGALLIKAHKSAEAATVLARTVKILDATAASADTRARVEAELATARGH